MLNSIPTTVRWTKSVLRNLGIYGRYAGDRQLAWLTVNRQDFVDYKMAMRV